MILKNILIFAIFCLTKATNLKYNALDEKTQQGTEHLNNKESGIDLSLFETQAKDIKHPTAYQENLELKIEPVIKHFQNQYNQSETKKNNQKNSIPNVLNVVQMSLNDEDKVMLQNLNGIIEKIPNMEPDDITRKGKLFKDEDLRRNAEALTDDEITEIIKSISHPNHDDITEDSESFKTNLEMVVEPRSSEARHMSKSFKSGKGYYVIVFTPIPEEANNDQRVTMPYSRLQILPAERSASVDDTDDDPRLISKKSWNKYIRRIMRQIRKGTRKIQRKTKFKSLEQEEPTVENFLTRMFKIAQEQQKIKKKSSWFIW